LGGEVKFYISSFLEENVAVGMMIIIGFEVLTAVVMKNSGMLHHVVH
jgi:hypothetical protein